jgi:hypothetical protein
MLAEKSGFEVQQVVYDSNEFQFWASESYQRDIPLHEMTQPSSSQLRRMRRLAGVLNAQEQGDMAQFYLKLSSKRGQAVEVKAFDDSHLLEQQAVARA